jgi:hypothetical protein
MRDRGNMEGLIILIMFFGIAFIGFLAWAIAELVCFIQNRKWKKWCNFVFATYPELMPLLIEYKRTRHNTVYTITKIEEIKKEIVKQVEENKYLPKGDRVDGYIETLKEKYIWLKDLLEKQRVEENEKEEELNKFWETNFPNVREDKRIMWWSE